MLNSINGTVVRLDPARLTQAIQAAEKNGADDVFVKAENGDTYAISNKGLNTKDLTYGKVVTFEDGHEVRQGTVIATNNEANTFLEGMKKYSGVALGAGVVAGAISIAVVYQDASKGFEGIALFFGALTATPVAVGAAATGSAGGGVFSAVYKPNYELLKQFSAR